MYVCVRLLVVVVDDVSSRDNLLRASFFSLFFSLLPFCYFGYFCCCLLLESPVDVVLFISSTRHCLIARLLFLGPSCLCSRPYEITHDKFFLQKSTYGHTNISTTTTTLSLSVFMDSLI